MAGRQTTRTITRAAAVVHNHHYQEMVKQLIATETAIAEKILTEQLENGSLTIADLES